MVGRCHRTLTFRAAVILLGFVSGAALFPTGHAYAQGLTDAFSRIFGGRSTQRSQPPSYADPFGFLAPETLNQPTESGGPVATYCVRLCDGHYFPLPRNAGTPNSSPDKICGAMCPASPTKVYTGSQIDQASAADGTRYAKLENAFVYRERLVPNCACTGKENAGTAAIDINSDPTLRPGDIVITKDGPMVFKGSKQVPHQTNDFIPAKDYKGLPASVRRTLAEMRVAPEPITAAPAAATAVPVSAPEPPSWPTLGPQASRAPNPRPTPVSEAFSTFQR